jgi:manganese transport protein
MQGFVRIRIPVWLRRLVTMAPAFVVIAMGVNPTKALVMSQVVLSIALPVPMLALLHFTSNKRIMGEFANARHVFLLAILAAGVVLGLNFVLLALTFGVPVPFLPK